MMTNRVPILGSSLQQNRISPKSKVHILAKDFIAAIIWILIKILQNFVKNSYYGGNKVLAKIGTLFVQPPRSYNVIAICRPFAVQYYMMLCEYPFGRRGPSTRLQGTAILRGAYTGPQRWSMFLIL